MELEALTSVIARTAGREVFSEGALPGTSLAAAAAGARRVAGLVRALLPRFTHTPDPTDTPEHHDALYYKVKTRHSEMRVYESRWKCVSVGLVSFSSHCYVICSYKEIRSTLTPGRTDQCTVM